MSPAAATMAPTRRARRPALPLWLGGLALLAIAAYGPLWVLARDPAIDAFPGATPLISLSLAAVGTIVARHEPRNPVGWMILLAGIGNTVGTDCAMYAVLDYRRHGGHLPLGQLAVWGGWLWEPGVVLVAPILVLFPDGVVPSPRWAWALRAYALVGGAWLLTTLAVVVGGIARGPIRVDRSGNLAVVDHPSGWAAPVSELAVAALGLMLLTWVPFAVRMVTSWRRATGVRRQQMSWLMTGAALTVVTAIPVIAIGTLQPATVPTGVAAIAAAVLVLGITALPAAIGVAVLRYRLYDIDRLVSRTVAYALVTASLAGLYFGVVAFTTRVLDLGSALGVAASTLAAAALFTPLRRRLQRQVDRRFNRARYDADAAVTRFTARLRDTVDVGEVERALGGEIAHTLEPLHCTVWMRPPA